MIPRYCTSMHCSNYGCDYCAECSHAMHFGAGVDVKGKHWWWEFNPYFGPTFLRKDGEPMRCEPSMKSPAWDVFHQWMIVYEWNQYRHMFE